MKIKWMICFLLFGLIGFVFLINNNSSYYFIEIPIKPGASNTPYTQIEIEGISYSLEIDTGSKIPLTLRKPLLDKITNKQYYGTGTWKDMKGISYHTPKYLVRKIKIGNFTFKDIVIQQADDDEIYNTTVVHDKEKKHILEREHGAIGRPLLEKVNLLLDLNSATLIATNQREKLKKKGYDLDTFIKVPFDISRMGITINVETDFGVKKFFLDTACTLNMIKSSIVKDCKLKNGVHGLPFYLSQKFIIEGMEFGSRSLYSYEITPELNEIDGIIGVSFLEKHILYIDFPNRLLFIKSI